MRTRSVVPCPNGRRPLLRAAPAALVLMALAAAAPAGAATTRTFHPVEAATVRADRPRATGSQKLSLRRGRATYLKFRVALAAGERVLSASLRLHPARAVTVRTAPSGWSARTITWRRRPRPGRRATTFARTGTVTYVLTSSSRRTLGLDTRRTATAPAIVLTTTGAGPGAAQAAPGEATAGAATASAAPAATPAPAAVPTAPATAPTPVPTTVPAATPTATPTATPVATPTPNPSAACPFGPLPAAPSGQPAPAGDLPGWAQVFLDDFTQPVALGGFPNQVASTWWAYPKGWPDTSGSGVYDAARTVSAAGGVLDLWPHTEAGVHYAAAPTPRLPGSTGGITTTPSGRLYGRYSVRFCADPLPSYKLAWMLWPDSKDFPNDGEIDFPEGDLDQTVLGYVHHQGASKPHDQDAFRTATPFSGWHTATIEWTPGLVRLFLDGAQVGQTTDRVPDTPMHWVLQTETQVLGAVPDDEQGHVRIDWVAVWKPA